MASQTRTLSEAIELIPELGHLALVLSLVLAVILSVVPLVGAARGQVFWMGYARPLAWGQFFFLVTSFACLTYAFVVDDFSVAYVANNSNTALPVEYKVSAVWGAHEGSLLLWVLVLAAWTFAVSLFSRHLPLPLVARVLAVMGMISTGFLLFTLFTSNPFDRLLPNSPAEGGDLNPLLQDVGLIFHPPLLYMGYVGFSVAFAFAVAALLGGRLDSAWARWSRPWTNLAWVFLTLGIALGSYWAYYELGWGGWWFWDPVENASFMPWLVGTALVHSLAVTDKRGLFKSWTVLLAILAFSLSLLGTFLVRSGVLTSVHAFASDPTRGLFILLFLAVVIGGSLILYALRAPTVTNQSSFNGWSREFLLLVNNIILVITAGIVLLGTLAPLIVQAFGERISVGRPYFDFFFSICMSVLFVFLGLAALSNWKQGQFQGLVRQALVGLIASLALSLLLPLLLQGELALGPVLAVLFSVWIIAGSLKDISQKTRNQLSRLGKLSLSVWGMHLAHVGVAIAVIGAVFSASYSEQKDVRMAAGDSLELAGYEFILRSINPVQGPNYSADEGIFEVYRDGQLQYVMKPQKRLYTARQQVMTEAAIDTGFTRDLYISMGEPLANGAWGVRVYYKAFIDWIWVGALLMGLGGLLAICDKRYRVRRAQPVTETMAVESAS